MSLGGSSSGSQLKRMCSYKEERIKSVKKLDLNLTITTQSDLDRISDTIKSNLSRRVSQTHSTSIPDNTSLHKSTRILTEESSTYFKNSENESILRHSFMSPKLMEKYICSTNILEVSEEENIPK